MARGVGVDERLIDFAHFQGSWWEEGDEMIFIDEDTWPPSLHGTGSAVFER